MPHRSIRPVPTVPAAVLLALTALSAALPPAARAQEAEAARPEVAKPLEAAEADIRAKKYDEAAKEIARAEAVKGRTPYETFLIEQTGGVLAQSRGDTDEALKDFKDLLASGRLPASERPRIEQTIAALAFSKQDYPQAIDFIQRTMKDGNKDPSLPGLLVQAYYQSGDYANAAKLTQQAIADQRKAGKPPTEAQLQMLAACADKTKDQAGFQAALEQLATYYPNPDIWGNLMSRLLHKPGVSGRNALAIDRLKLQLGLLKTPQDYETAAQEALAAGFPGEAQSYIAAGYAANVLGQAADAPRQQRLKEYAAKQLASDQAGLKDRVAAAQDAHGGQDLVRVGYDMVTQGDASGLGLIEQGIKKDDLAKPDDAKLLLAQAYLKLNRTADALAVFKTVQGEGTADIAHLWVLILQPKPKV